MSEHVDVCIIGGGIIGLYCAAELAQAGLLVRLVDKQYNGSSRDNVGDITPHGHPPLLGEFVNYSLKCWQQGSETLVQNLGVDKTGSVQFAFRKEEAARLKKEVEMSDPAGEESRFLEGAEQIAEALGEVKIAEEALAAKITGSDLAVDTTRALNKLRQYLVQSGVRIWGSDEVKEFLLDQEGAVRGVRTYGGDTCIAEETLLCAGVHAPRLLKPLGVNIPIRPARCHILEMSPNGPVPEQVLIQPEPRGFLRMSRRESGRVLVSYDGILDQKHSTFRQQEDAETVAWMRQRIGEVLPALYNAELHETRVITLAMTPDLMPCIGPYQGKEGLLIAVGMNGRSYAYAAGVAGIMKALLQDEPYPVDLSQVQADRFETEEWHPLDIVELLPDWDGGRDPESAEGAVAEEAVPAPAEKPAEEAAA
jgi:sarcosine oxidase subunit beta